MRNLQRYVGRLVQLRPASFRAFLASTRQRGRALENRFVVGSAIRRQHMLVCYGANLSLLVAPADVLLV